MLTIYWQMDVVFLEAFTIFPLYVSLLIDIWTNRKKQKLFQSPYYTLILSQGLADILIILTIFNLLVARYFGFGNMLLYNIQDYGVASFHSNTGPLMFIVRMFGIFLITSQRYVAVCWHGSRLNVFIDRLHPLILVAIHYIFPCVIYIPAFIVSSAKFQDTERLFIINTPTHLQTFSIIVVSSFLVASVLVVFMYLSILRVLFITRKNGKNSMGQCVFRQQALRYREIRLAAHVFLLSVMSATIFVYYWIEFSMAGNPDDSGRKALRVYYPILSSNFSYINPLTLFALNKDIQKMIKAQFCRIVSFHTPKVMVSHGIIKNGSRSYMT